MSACHSGGILRFSVAVAMVLKLFMRKEKDEEISLKSACRSFGQ